jgi:hypothetical protein
MSPPDPRSPLAIPALLIRRLGPLTTLRVAFDVTRRLARGEPFSHLPPPETPRERQSRAQAAPVFLLYRALTALQVRDATSLVADLVELGAIAFLTKSIGPIRKHDLARMSEPERQRWVQTRAARFPNAEPVFHVVSPTEVRFTVPACRFVTLAQAAGHPELAPLFCRGDARYFGSVERGVALIRPHTLASGGPDCPFTIRFAPAAPDPRS